MNNDEKRNDTDQVEIAVHPEIEGSRYNWFYVCGDCHCVIKLEGTDMPPLWTED